MLFERLIALILELWERDKKKTRKISLISLFNMISKLTLFTFARCTYRSDIPVPKKPGKFEAITQPAHKDRLVLDAMARLLRDEF